MATPFRPPARGSANLRPGGDAVELHWIDAYGRLMQHLTDMERRWLRAEASVLRAAADAVLFDDGDAADHLAASERVLSRLAGGTRLDGDTLTAIREALSGIGPAAAGRSRVHRRAMRGHA